MLFIIKEFLRVLIVNTVTVASFYCLLVIIIVIILLANISIYEFIWFGTASNWSVIRHGHR